MKNFYVLKQNGKKEKFSEEKFKKAMKRARIDEFAVRQALKKVKKRLYNNIPTSKIYDLAFDALKNESLSFAGRYNLKRALFSFGPTGHPFEALVSEIFKNMGYQVKIGQKVLGRCVPHEVDVIAYNAADIFLMECKYHNSSKNITNLKVALYVHARFQDITERWKKQSLYVEEIKQGYIVTNTRCSSRAIMYSNCVGQKLISWDYPQTGNLRQLIENSGLHPITAVNSLSEKQKNHLLANNIVLIRQLLQKRNILRNMGVSQNKAGQILNEAESILFDENK